MEVPFLDLKAQYASIRDEVNASIQQVLENTAYVLGKSVSEFESVFASAHNVSHCIGVSSGTDGNHLALWSLGVKAGDEVIMPANTFIATAWGATLCGATPVFVDCEPDSYNIDPAKIEDAITPRTKAIVVVHLYGQPANLDPIRELCRKHHLFLVEDCAQAHFAEYKGRRIGGLGDIASFSFYPGKNLGAYGEAGAVTTNNDDLARLAKMMRDHGSEKKYDHEIFGHNYRMEGIQGAVLGVKMKYLDSWTEKRRAAAENYRRLLHGIGEIFLPAESPYAKHVYHLFVIRTSRRNELQRYLTENKIGTGLHYPLPLHLQKCFINLGYKKGDFPNSERLADEGLSLPMFAELSTEQMEYIAHKITKFFQS